MLTFRQLDDLPESVVSIMSETEQSIINDMARRIAKTFKVIPVTQWQMSRLTEIIGLEREYIIKELSRALNMTEHQLTLLFDEAATRTLATDDRLLKMAGYNPVPLKSNAHLQKIISAGLAKTVGEFRNLTRTTANTATRQFEQALDIAHTQIITGGMDYQTSIKNAIHTLTDKGLASITYPTGRTDYLDVATRRAVLTGVNQTAAEIQLANIAQMGIDLVETTAHPTARPTHAAWQGRVFSISGTHPRYHDLRANTGLGTGTGLCGWNCRHSFFPFFDGARPAYNAEVLRQYNNRTVMYNGKKLSLYDATQQQRHIERQIRKWKREADALDAAGLDSSSAKREVRKYQAQQRSFIEQTGLKRDYFRERAGKQNHEPMPILPNVNDAVVPSGKIYNYALNKNHVGSGRDKAIAFDQALGYNIGNADVLISDVRNHLHEFPAFYRGSTKYGRRYEVNMLLTGPNGKTAPVRTGWIIEKNKPAPRLTTVFVDR